MYEDEIHERFRSVMKMSKFESPFEVIGIITGSSNSGIRESGTGRQTPMAPGLAHPSIEAGNHQGYMEYALQTARLAAKVSTRFCVGAVLVDADKNEVLSTGYSMEIERDRPGDPGSTHAEQCCLIKVTEMYGLPDDQIETVIPKNTVLYTTMEPCNERLSGNTPCVERILKLKNAITAVYVGIREPDTFISENSGIKRLEDAGIAVHFVEGMQDRILNVSMMALEK
ncbi:hypothetical protein FQN49_000435 [Arthroderma sp. PD_2]|nr:hypothetical protein FQN49_000435 [Arthroderma sp. PD_2]